MNPNDLLLSHWNSKEEVFLSGDVVQRLKPFHYMSIRFLYNCFKKNYSGAILNQEENMNLPLQVSAFLHMHISYYKSVTSDPVIVLSFDNRLPFWFYHLTVDGNFIVTTDLGDYDNSKILLASLSDIKALQNLKERQFSVVIMDEFDKVAKKTVLRRLLGQFNIGLTYRNFIKNPDQKLQWSMLRWSNPNAVGTFAAFCETDNEHFDNFSEPFTDFWQKLTWHYYDEYTQETSEQKEDYIERVKQLAKEHGITSGCNISTKKRTKRKIKNTKQIEEQPIISERTTEEMIAKNNLESDKDSSQDTIIYEFEDIPGKNSECANSIEIAKEKSPYVELPSMDESPILNSIIRNLSEPQTASCSYETDPDDIKTSIDDSVLSFLFTGPSCSSAKDINTSPLLEDEMCSSPESYDKSKLLSELFGE